MKKEVFRSMAVILVFVLLLGTGFTAFAEPDVDIINTLKDLGTSLISSTIKAISEVFKDIKESDWFADIVKKLVDAGGIDGYPDGTFKPNNTITRAEFTKVLVSALGHNDLAKTSTHWASGFVDKAVSMKLTSKDELKDLDKPIPRKEMAKMVANALDYRGETHVANRNDYKNQIKDFNSISASYQDFVLKAYTKGIITGYPDGTFGGDKGLTRAEASSVVLRVIETSERKLPPQPTPTTESGPNVDLNRVSVTSKADVNIRGPQGDGNPHNVDFNVLLKTWEPLAPQHVDTENLLIARFGKNNSTVNEIIKYIKTKDIRAKELKLKTWNINGQQISVQSNPNGTTIDLTVWRTK